MPRKTADEKRAETRSRLIDAAIATFLARGYHAASLDEISERAGYSTGAIYSNFDGKEALFLACGARFSERQSRIWEDFIAEVKESGAQPDGFGEVLVSVLPERDWTRALMEFRVSATSELSRRTLIERQRDWHATVSLLLEAFCHSNGLTPKLPYEIIADSVVSVIDGLLYNLMIDPDTEIVRIFSTTLNLLLDAPPSADR